MDWNLANPGSIPITFGNQINNLFNILNNLLNSSMNAKVLLPAQPTFLLELIDLLCVKLSEQVKIVVISESSNSVMQYANINLESLNTKLQDKIYITENPLSFEKLLKAGRMQIFASTQDYLNSKRTSFGIGGSKIIPNDYCRELFITSNETLRMGDAS
jgi:hypothetical protein